MDKGGVEFRLDFVQIWRWDRSYGFGLETNCSGQKSFELVIVQRFTVSAIQANGGGFSRIEPTGDPPNLGQIPRETKSHRTKFTLDNIPKRPS